MPALTAGAAIFAAPANIPGKKSGRNLVLSKNRRENALLGQTDAGLSLNSIRSWLRLRDISRPTEMIVKSEMPRIVPFPRWRVASAMAGDAMSVVLRLDHATERSLKVRHIRELIAAGVDPAEARRCGDQYGSALARWVSLARQYRGGRRDKLA